MPNPKPSYKFQAGHAVRQKPGPPGLKLSLNKTFSNLIRDKVGFELGHEPTEAECLEYMRKALAEWLLDAPPEAPKHE